MSFRSRYQWVRITAALLFLLTLTLAMVEDVPFLYWLGFLLVFSLSTWQLTLRAMTCPACRKFALTRNDAGELDLPLLGPAPGRCGHCGFDLGQE